MSDKRYMNYHYYIELEYDFLQKNLHLKNILDRSINHPLILHSTFIFKNCNEVNVCVNYN